MTVASLKTEASGCCMQTPTSEWAANCWGDNSEEPVLQMGWSKNRAESVCVQIKNGFTYNEREC